MQLSQTSFLSKCTSQVRWCQKRQPLRHIGDENVADSYSLKRDVSMPLRCIRNDSRRIIYKPQIVSGCCPLALRNGLMRPSLTAGACGPLAKIRRLRTVACLGYAQYIRQTLACLGYARYIRSTLVQLYISRKLHKYTPQTWIKAFSTLFPDATRILYHPSTAHEGTLIRSRFLKIIKTLEVVLQQFRDKTNP